MTVHDIEPVSRESTAGIIARQLRAAIMNGALAPGTQLTEADLAAQFEVSRGPLREAMQRLVQEGLLRSELHRGLFVIDLDAADVDDIYLARTAVERAAVTRIVRADSLRQTAVEQLSEVQELMVAAARAGDQNAMSDADLRFHEVLVESSGSKRLVRMAQTLLAETRMCLSALQLTYRTAEERVDEHRQIVEAIREADEEQVLHLLEAHMIDAVNRLAPRP
ncbi:MAG: GntR family transcriptional regulator [Micromonosporaceae bacterium]